MAFEEGMSADVEDHDRIKEKLKQLDDLEASANELLRKVERELYIQMLRGKEQRAAGSTRDVV